MIYTTQNSQKAMYIGFPLHGHNNFGRLSSSFSFKKWPETFKKFDTKHRCCYFFFDAIFFQQDESKVVFFPSHSDTVSDFLILSSMKNLVGWDGPHIFEAYTQLPGSLEPCDDFGCPSDAGNLGGLLLWILQSLWRTWGATKSDEDLVFWGEFLWWFQEGDFFGRNVRWGMGKHEGKSIRM